MSVKMSLKYILHGVHCAGLSDWSVRGAARRQFSQQVAQLFHRSSDGKMNVQSVCALNTRYFQLHVSATRGHLQATRFDETYCIMLKLMTMMTCISEYYRHKRARCSRFHQNVLPEDAPVWSKHAARNRKNFNDILRTFN
jgi:hypothetical protein